MAEFRRYEAGEPADVPIKFEGPAAREYHFAGNAEEEVEAYSMAELVAVPDNKPIPQACKDVALAAIAKLAPNGNPATLDPVTMLILAKVVLSIVENCDQTKIEAFLKQIKRRPNGVTAIMARFRILGLLPVTYNPEQKFAAARALMAAGVDLLDSPEGISHVCVCH